MRRLPAILLGAVLLTALALWLARAPLIETFALRELQRRGVPASGRIVAATSTRLTIENARLGSPARPDATAARATIRFSLRGREVTAIDLEGATLNAVLTPSGRLALGSLDRLLPPPSGEPPRLPDISLALRNARLNLRTPYGALRANMSGDGNPASRFTGQARLLPAALTLAACPVQLTSGNLALSARNRRPQIMGTLAFGPLVCRGISAESARARFDLQLDDPITAAQGQVTLVAARPAAAAARADQFTLSCDGRTLPGSDGAPEAIACNWRFVATGLRTPELQAAALSHAAPLTITLAPEAKATWSRGWLLAEGAALAPSARATLASATESLTLTPLGPLEAAARRAAARAAAGFRLATEIEAAADASSASATLTGARLAAASGARAVLGGRILLATNGWTALTPLTLDVAGGGFPAARAAVASNARTARVTVPGWSSGGATLAATTLSLAAIPGGFRLAGPLTLSGPLGPGRIEALAIPDADLLVRLNPVALTLARCITLSATSVDQPRYRLAAPRAQLCPSGETLALNRDTLSGAFTIRDFTADATVNATQTRLNIPLTTARVTGSADAPVVALAAQRVTAVLPSENRQFEAARFTAIARSTPSGWRFDGDFAGGQTAAGPAELTAAAGRWSMDQTGQIRLADGAALLRDPAPRPAFAPLRLAAAKVDYDGEQAAFTARVLHAPTATPLGQLSGIYAETTKLNLDFTVPFGPALQPYQLSESARGLIENAAGAVSLTARLTYASGALTGPGRLSTQNLDFATAALGPVTGLKTDLAFTDLVALTSPPGQRVTIASVNPGVELRQGEASIQLLGERRIAIDALAFPFAGGTLSLAPTTLDPTKPERNFILQVRLLDAAQFINFLRIDNLYATGLFDGSLPVRLSARGGRIEGGLLTARAPGGSLRYVGPIGSDLPAAARLAFDALKSLRYRTLSLGVNGDIDGEIVTDLKFTGENEAPIRAAGPASLPPGVPFRFNVSVTAPFRRLLGSVGGFSDARPLITQGLATPEEPFSPPQPPKPD